MHWFKRSRNPRLPTLVTLPKGGDPIVLDQEELHAVSARSSGDMQQTLIDAVETTAGEGRRLPEPVLHSMEDIIMIEGFMKLLDLAKQRMSAGHFAAAAQTCVKVIGLGGALHNAQRFAAQEAWLLLAEVHTRYGDLARGASALRVANRQAKEEIKRLVAQGPNSHAALHEFLADWNTRSDTVKELIHRSRKR